MTKILLAGLTLAVILAAIGSSAQGFAMPDKSQGIIEQYIKTQNSPLDQNMILVSDPPTMKGGKATFHLIPKPQVGPDDIPIAQTNTPDLVLTSVKTPDSKTILKLLPRIQEGIDGTAIPKKMQENITPIPVAAEPEKILVSVATPNGGSTLKLIPKPQEGIDGAPIPKTPETQMMLVVDPVTSKGGAVIFHLVPKPALDSRDSSS
ncbi:MAG: hypothetical protein KGH76_05155 [Thaumarchaeota archaeon]|nr:hypothetical protein [Nitrososphaerota archaeon]